MVNREPSKPIKAFPWGDPSSEGAYRMLNTLNETETTNYAMYYVAE
jgi:hypothetical protein